MKTDVIIKSRKDVEKVEAQIAGSKKSTGGGGRGDRKAAQWKTSEGAWNASIAVVKWLLNNRRDISAYRLSETPRAGVRIISETPKKALEACALRCDDYELVSLLTDGSAEVEGFVCPATKGGARADYIFATLPGADGEEFEQVKKKGRVVVMVQKELALLAHTKKGVA